MSELIAFVFRDQYRAPEVLNELRRRDWPWVRDLDDAVAITVDDKGKARVHLCIDLSTYEAAHWARLWGSLLNSTLFLPFTDVMAEAADGFTISSTRSATASRPYLADTPESKWWKEALEDSDHFRRDVAASMFPKGSAIFILLRAADAPVVLKQLGDYGDTIVHTSVSLEQDNKIRAILAAG